MQPETKRYVALDLHQSYCVVGAVDRDQQVVLTPRRVSSGSLMRWARQHLDPTDEVVIEASPDTWAVHDQLAPLVARVVVAHPYHIKLIASSMVKTDKRDTLTLARLLAARLIPEVWVPPVPVRQLRALVSHRQRLVSQRTAAKSRLRAVLRHHQLVPPSGKLFSQQNRQWWHQVPLPPVERLCVQHHLDTVARVTQQIEDTNRELARLSVSEHWRTSVVLLIQLPGIGLTHAMTILGAIGDITRFATPRKLVGYAGLGGRVHASGKTYRTGGITKQGRTELRRTLIEAAWLAVTFSPVWKRRYQALAARTGKLKAITAIARKLLVVVWHVLTHQEAERQADPAAVRRALLRWAAQHRLATSLGLSHAAFVQQALQQLNLTP